MGGHSEDDPEFRIYPHHCVSGTVGQRKPALTLLEKSDAARQVILEKQELDCFSNPTLAPLLAELAAVRYVVYGVVTAPILAEGGYLAGDSYIASGLFPANDPAGYFWSRAGQRQYPVNPEQTFFLPSAYLDAFGNQTKVHYAYNLLVDQVTDPLGNVTSVDKFDFRFLMAQA